MNSSLSLLSTMALFFEEDEEKGEGPVAECIEISGKPSKTYFGVKVLSLVPGTSTYR